MHETLEVTQLKSYRLNGKHTAYSMYAYNIHFITKQIKLA